MKVSRTWLEGYFEKPLPDVATLAEALTFHAFEIESVEGDVFDVKVLPNRAADCLSHRGVAKELSAILNIPLKRDPLRETLPDFPKTNELMVTADRAYVLRHTGALLRGVAVGPSPTWLSEALQSVGQRSINNIVDVLNFVMLDIGQPSGAFDAGKLVVDNGVTKIVIRRAKQGEKITILTGEEFALTEQMFVFTDAVGGALLDIAGIKGGRASGVTEATTDLFVSVGNYEGTLVRRTSQALRIFTDASQRYQNRPSPELTAYGMRDILALIAEVAKGEVVGVVDVYPSGTETAAVSVPLSRINDVLGSSFSSADVADVFKRLDFKTEMEDEVFTVTPPFERRDIVIPEDLVEEVGRIQGYDRIPATELPKASAPPDQARFRGIERMKDQLIEQGFTEVSTQSFAKTGDVILANPLDTEKPALRTTLEGNLEDALRRAKLSAPLVLLPGETPRIFEIGTVFPKAGEFVELRMTERVPAWGDAAGTFDNLSIAKLEAYGAGYEPKRYAQGAYQSFSVYPFVVRDIAFWALHEMDADSVKSTIQKEAGSLLVRCSEFDRFEKEGRSSYAFRLVFQSDERTLTDREVNTIIERVSAALTAEGYEIR